MIRENTKIMAAFVVPVVIIAAVAGYYLYPVEEPLRIEEGYAEMTLEYLDEKGSTKPINKSVTATTIVDNNSELEFVITVTDVTSKEGSGLTQVDVYLEAVGEFKEELTLEYLRFTARTLPYVNSVAEVNKSICQVFRDSHTEIDNGSCWPLREQKNSARGEEIAFIGFDLDDNDFKTISKLVWEIPFDHEEPYTLELSVIVDGMSEKVKATVYVHITPPERGEEI